MPNTLRTLLLVILVTGAPVAADDEIASRGFTPIGSVAELDEHLASASDQMVAVRFTADWSITDGEMDKIFASDDVQALLTGMLLLEVDVTDNTGGQQKLLKRYDIVGAPWTIFLDKDGKRIKEADLAGYRPKPEVIEHLRHLLQLQSH